MLITESGEPTVAFGGGADACLLLLPLPLPLPLLLVGIGVGVGVIAGPLPRQVEVLHCYGHAGAKALADPVSAETSALAPEGVTMRPPDLPMAPTNVRVVETLPIVLVNGVRSAELEVCFALQPSLLSCRAQPLARANLGMPSLYGLSRADGLRFAAGPSQCATACRSLGTRAKC
jgi:hypothetical protein